MESSKTITYQYTFKPLATGKYTIPAFTVSNKNQRYSSKTFEVEVVDGSIRGSSRQVSRNTRQPQHQQQQPAENVSTEDIIFVSGWADKKQAYVGEPITITYNLYTRADIMQIQMTKDASYSGFWAEELFNANSLDYSNQTIKGVPYRMAPIKKVALYAGTSGKKKTDPMTLAAIIRTAGRGFFDFFGSQRQVEITSKPINLEILPLPEQGKPADFSGAVGDFSITMEADQTSAPAGNAIQVAITITGTGNLKTIENIKPDFPHSFEIYSENSSEKVINKNSSQRQKRYEYVVIPREKGIFTIPASTVSFFNPATKKYERANSGALSLDITEGTGGYPSGSGMTIVQKDDVISVGKDIAFIKTELPQKSNRLKHPDYTMLLAIPAEFLLMVIALFIRKKRMRLLTDSGFARFVGASATAVNRIKRAKKDAKNYLSDIAEALDSFICDKLNITYGEKTSDMIYTMLTERGMSSEFISKLKTLHGELDIARFAPGASGLNNDDAEKRALAIIKEIEKNIKTRG